jgi:hypothetical protein
MSAYRNRVQEATWKLDEFSPNPCTMASESAVPMLQPEEASTGEEGEPTRMALTDGLETCATERTAEDGCSMKEDQAAAKKAGISEFLYQGAMRWLWPTKCRTKKRRRKATPNARLIRSTMSTER